MTIAVLGAGIQGCCLALALARRGYAVDLFDRLPQPMSGTSVHTEGKIHLGFVYAKDPRRETHRLMARGGLAFASTLREIADIEPHHYAAGWRFHYAVLRHSQLSHIEIEAHFEQVKETILASQARSNDTYLGQRVDRIYRRISDADLRRHFDPATVQSAFETMEEAIDTHRLAELIRGAISRHPNIRFHGKTQVSSAAIDSESEVRVVLSQDGVHTDRVYAAVANCMWAGRLELDATLDLAPERPWLFRFKALARLAAPELVSCPVLSTTLIVGPFGDVVNYGDGSFYISWYPRFKLAQTHERDGEILTSALDGVDQQQLAHDGVIALSRFIPDITRLLESRRDFQVSGGVIFQLGRNRYRRP